MKSLIRPLRLWVSVCSVFSPAATTRRCLGRVQFHVQDLTHVSSPGIDTGNSPVGRPSPEVMGTYCTQNEHLLLELTQKFILRGCGFFLLKPRAVFTQATSSHAEIASICRRPASLDLGLAFRWPISRARRSRPQGPAQIESVAFMQDVRSVRNPRP